jgi:hypothetical protein
MNILALASGLSDQDLLARVGVLAGKEREASVELVAHLAALDARPALFAAEGHGSLFTYCTEVLRLSEDATCNRIQAARACRDFPVILEALASGAMSLTSVRLLRRHLTPENHQAILARACGRSRARSRPWSRNWRHDPMSRLPSGNSQRLRQRPRSCPRPRRRRRASRRPRLGLPNRRYGSALHRRYGRLPVRSSRPPRRSAIASSSRLARRATRSFGAFRLFSAGRFRTAIRERSSTAPSPCSSRKWRKPSSGQPRSRGRGLSAPGRIGSFAHPLSLRGISRGTSSVGSRSVMAGSAPSSPETDTDARSARSWSSITSCRMRREDGPPSRTSPFVAGATTNARRNWPSGLTVLRWCVRRRGLGPLRREATCRRSRRA